MSVHHLGTVFAHGLQVVDLALQERYLRFQVLVLLTHREKKTKTSKQTVEKREGEGYLNRQQVDQLTDSFLPMVLLWERERVMLKKDSFLVAERGGDEVLTSLPLEGGRGGEAVD